VDLGCAGPAMGGQPATAPAADARADTDRVAGAFGQAAATAAAATLGRRGNPQNKNLGFNPPGSLL
jgi:hypothetical protein